MKVRRELFVVVCFCLLASLLFATLFSVKHIIAGAEKSVEGKVYCNATLDDNFTDDCIIVTLQNSISGVNKVHNKSYFSGVEIESIEDLTKRENNFEVKDNFHQILKINLKKRSKEAVLYAIKKIEALEGVFSAEPNMILEAESVSNDDPLYTKQWALESISAPLAWDYVTGSRQVRVGVIDTGIATHSDLNANIVSGYDFYNKNEITNDDETGHGTGVAGIIGAKGNNGQGVSGINWNLSIVPMQVSYWDERDSKYMFNRVSIIDAINWATDCWNTNDKIQILNYSASLFGSDISVKNAVTQFPGLFVWSAGNSGQNVDNYEYIDEFNLNNLISVGAIDKYNERSIWAKESSCYGSKVNIFAPGGKGFSDSENSFSTALNNGYDIFNGTSAAAPHVTGVAALMLAAEPTLTAAELKEYIIKYSDNITISTPDGSQNVKKLNAYKAVEYAYYCKQPYRDLFAGGTGAAYDPFIIRNESQFRNMQFAHRPVYITYQGYEEQINYYFKLDNNITLSGDWTPFPYKFSGVFDGCNHSITYNMNLTSGDMNLADFGLFGFVTGKIRNLTLPNCRIISDVNETLISFPPNVSSPSASIPGIGILAGAVFETSIENISVVEPYIECNIQNAAIGGIAGSTNRTSVENCTVSGGEIISYSGCLGGMAGLGDIGNYYGGSCNTTIRKNNYSDSDLVGPIVGNSQERSTVGGTTTIENDSPCVAKGTLITLADGRQVPVETLTGNEMLLVWNLQTGSFDSAPILFIDSDPWQTYKVINLAFSDGTSVKVIYEHGFWDYDLNEYVYLREDAAQYIGHWFNKQGTDGNGNMISQRVQLTDVSVQYEATAAYSPVTYGHLCYYVNGMLSMPGGAGGLFNTFDVDAATMKYDEAQMQADIAEYGLFTYEEFYNLVPVSEEAFEAFNGQYLKVAIGKGLIDTDKLNQLAVRYAEYLG